MKHKPFDLNLPNWGPYGKEYVGLSHVADAEAGDRWDCFVMPGYHRRAVIGPYAVRENRWHHWKTAPDLSSYTLRYELEWKDQVYEEATFSGKGRGASSRSNASTAPTCLRTWMSISRPWLKRKLARGV